MIWGFGWSLVGVCGSLPVQFAAVRWLFAKKSYAYPMMTLAVLESVLGVAALVYFACVSLSIVPWRRGGGSRHVSIVSTLRAGDVMCVGALFALGTGATLASIVTLPVPLVVVLDMAVVQVASAASLAGRAGRDVGAGLAPVAGLASLSVAMVLVYLWIGFEDNAFDLRSLDGSTGRAIGLCGLGVAFRFASGALLRGVLGARAVASSSRISPTTTSSSSSSSSGRGDGEGEGEGEGRVAHVPAEGPFGKLYPEDLDWASHLSDVRDTFLYDGELVGLCMEASFEIRALFGLALIPLGLLAGVVYGTPVSVLNLNEGEDVDAFRVGLTLMVLAGLAALRPLAVSHVVLHQPPLSYVVMTALGSTLAVIGAVVMVPGEAESVGVFQFSAIAVILAVFVTMWKVSDVFQVKEAHAAHAQLLEERLPSLAAGIEMEAYVASALYAQAGTPLAHFLAMEQTVDTGHHPGARDPLAISSLLVPGYMLSFEGLDVVSGSPEGVPPSGGLPLGQAQPAQP